MQTLHGKGSTGSGNSNSTSHSIISRSGLENFVFINDSVRFIIYGRCGQCVYNDRLGAQAPCLPRGYATVTSQKQDDDDDVR